MTSANQITILRMVFVPVFVVLMVYNHIAGALAVFILAGATDLLDGLIARRFSQKTPLGTLLDPIADKLLLNSAFILLSLDTLGLTLRVPLWITITVIGRDVLLIVSVVIINLTLGPRLFAPALIGKITTALQLLTVLVVLVGNQLLLEQSGMMERSLSSTTKMQIFFYIEWLFYGMFIATVVSGLHYLVKGMKIFGYDREEDF